MSPEQIARVEALADTVRRIVTFIDAVQPSARSKELASIRRECEVVLAEWEALNDYHSGPQS